MAFPLRYFLCLLLLALPATLAQAQASPKDVASSLEKKTIFLRDGYSEDNLAFDPQGNPSGNLTPGNFPLSAITVQKVKLNNSELEIQGERNVLILTGTNNPSETADIRSIPIKKRKIRIAIQEDAAHPEALALAVQKIFALSTQDVLAEKTPEQRERWLTSLASLVPEIQPDTPPKPATSIALPGFDKVYVPGHVQGVAAPKLIFSVEAQYTDEARRLSADSVCILSIIADRNGNPAHIRIIQPAGLGLDENAVVAVSQYRFSPAIFNGQAVGVQMRIQVHFRMR